VVEYYIKSGRDRARSAVLDKLVEFAVLGWVEDESVLDVHPLLDEPMYVVASPSHPFASLDSPTLLDLSRQNLLFLHGPILSRGYIMRRLGETAETLSVEELGNTEAVKEAAISGRGIAILPRTVVKTEIVAGVLAMCQIADFMPVRTAYVVRSRRLPLSAAASAFLTMAGRFELDHPLQPGSVGA
jgi:DNA-binding transcriptional LysR family regulator